MLSSNGAFASMYEHENDPDSCSPGLVNLDVEDPEGILIIIIWNLNLINK